MGTSLIFGYQGNKLMSGILFAVLLNFKHIYMYLAVGQQIPFNVYPFTLPPYPARIFRLFVEGLLLFTIRQTSDWEFPLPRQRCHWRFHRVSRSFSLNGANPSTFVSPFPFHARAESCLLGT